MSAKCWEVIRDKGETWGKYEKTWSARRKGVGILVIVEFLGALPSHIWVLVSLLNNFLPHRSQREEWGPAIYISAGPTWKVLGLLTFFSLSLFLCANGFSCWKEVSLLILVLVCVPSLWCVFVWVCECVCVFVCVGGCVWVWVCVWCVCVCVKLTIFLIFGKKLFTLFVFWSFRESAKFVPERLPATENIDFVWNIFLIPSTF